MAPSSVADTVGIILDIAALGVACALTAKLLFSSLDGGTSSSSRVIIDEKRQKLIEKLRSRKPRMGADGKPLKLTLREHELEVASDVVAPSEIDVTFEDIGGLQVTPTCARSARRHPLLMRGLLNVAARRCCLAPLLGAAARRRC